MIIPTELVDEEFKGEASPRTGAPARKSSRASVTAHSFLGSQKSMRNSFMAVANSAAYQSEVAELLEVYDANGDGSYCKDVRVFHPIPPSKTTCSRNSCAPPRAPRGVPRIFCHFSERPTCFYPPRRPPATPSGSAPDHPRCQGAEFSRARSRERCQETRRGPEHEQGRFLWETGWIEKGSIGKQGAGRALCVPMGLVISYGPSSLPAF